MFAERLCRTVAVIALAVLAASGGALADDGGAQSGEDPIDIGVSFPEDGGASEWKFGWHGYARMALRMHESPTGDRPPYLIDDRYFESGFAYTRVNEGSWAELQLSAEKRRTRFVAGLFASEFSDWSQVKLEQQSGIATAFVEHRFVGTDPISVRLRAGMFWERMGYFEPYDTYVFGRTHIAAAAIYTRIYDLVFVNLGHGAKAKVANQGFTPISWIHTGVDVGWLRTGLYGITTSMNDNDYDFGPLVDKKSSLRILGGDLKIAVPHVGPLYFAVSHYKADKVNFLGDSVETLHSVGGQKLTANYLGNDEDGTGEMLNVGFDFTWQPHRTLGFLADRATGRMLDGLDVRLFGLTTHVISEHRRDDPEDNRHDRRYLKWGTELLYRPANTRASMVFGALRFDRVILDTEHDSLGFRVLTPRVGITPAKGMDIFVSYSHYSYGDNLFAMPDVRQSVGDDTRPDEDVFKLQANVRW